MYVNTYNDINKVIKNSHTLYLRSYTVGKLTVWRGKACGKFGESTKPNH